MVGAVFYEDAEIVARWNPQSSVPTGKDTAYVPIAVNVYAFVYAQPPSGSSAFDEATYVAGGQTDTLRIPLSGTGGEKWTITVSAAFTTGYIDTTYTLTLVKGINTKQTITLRQSSSGGGVVGDNKCTSAETCKSKKMPDGKTWMTENLNIKASSGSWCYNDSDSYCGKYGRLYTWVAAMSLPDSCATKSCASQISSKHRGICPSGWHLPSSQEWTALVDSAGGYNNAGAKLKSRDGWYSSSGISSTDEYGFSALPGGFRYSGGSFYDAGGNGRWWTATEDDAYNAYHRIMGYYYDGVFEDDYDKGFALSARCIED